MRELLKRWLGEPLLHFAVLAACLIVFTPARGKQLVIERAQVESLVNGYQAKTGAAPSSEQRRALIASLVRDELLRHEAIALGLHESDPVVRRRLVQSMEYLAESPTPEGSASGAPPTQFSDADLRSELEAHPERYPTPETLDFHHIFAKTGPDSKARLLEIQRKLEDPAADAGAPGSGDPFIKGSKFRAKTRAQTSSLFGGQFAQRVFELAKQPGAQRGWLGPIESSYGWHLVRIQGYTQASVQSLEAARPALVAALSEARREQQRDAFVSKLAAQYEIRVDGAVWKFNP